MTYKYDLIGSQQPNQGDLHTFVRGHVLSQYHGVHHMANVALYIVRNSLGLLMSQFLLINWQN